jgi:hypothetical protein
MTISVPPNNHYLTLKWRCVGSLLHHNRPDWKNHRCVIGTATRTTATRKNNSIFIARRLFKQDNSDTNIRCVVLLWFKNCNLTQGHVDDFNYISFSIHFAICVEACASPDTPYHSLTGLTVWAIFLLLFLIYYSLRCARWNTQRHSNVMVA